MNKPLTPHITEKSYRGIAEEAASVSTYIFKVKADLNKSQIKKLVEKEYKVSVTDVRTVNLPGKVRRFRNIPGFVPGTTKAIVKLKKGDRIAAFDIEEKKDEKKEEKKS